MEKPDPTKELGETVAKYENLKRVEQKYNCKIEMIIVPWEELLAPAYDFRISPVIRIRTWRSCR
jgi:hypothetical protein